MAAAWKSGVYRVLPMGHVYLEFSIKFSLSECLLAYFFCSFVLRHMFPTFGKGSLSNQRINCPPVELIIGCVDKDWSLFVRVKMYGRRQQKIVYVLRWSDIFPQEKNIGGRISEPHSIKLLVQEFRFYVLFSSAVQ